jgi:hypothetical protein
VAALERLAGPRTRLIGVSHVPTSGGLVQPAAEIGRIARACGALFLLDATQSAGQFPVSADAIGCDLLTGTGRKFLRGPRGNGFLWARTAALDLLDPFVAEIGSATWDGQQGFTWAPGAGRFATWEHSYVNVLGLGAAVRQALDVGLRRSGSGPSRWAPGSAGSWPGCPASPSTTSAVSAAPSSPPRSTGWQRSRQPRPWPAPESTSRPRCPKTTRWTPKTATSTR